MELWRLGGALNWASRLALLHHHALLDSGPRGLPALPTTPSALVTKCLQVSILAHPKPFPPQEDRWMSSLPPVRSDRNPVGVPEKWALKGPRHGRALLGRSPTVLIAGSFVERGGWVKPPAYVSEQGVYTRLCSWQESRLRRLSIATTSDRQATAYRSQGRQPMNQPLCDIQFGPETQRVVATLGDPLASTCSIDFAKTWLAPEGGRVLGYASFEEAAAVVLAGDADYLLVPGAYPNIGPNFIFGDGAFRTFDQFVASLPDIVRVTFEGRPSIPIRLYFHAALTWAAELLVERWGPQLQCIEVSSNAVACQELLADSGAQALTNVIAAEAYGVSVVELLAEDGEMPCVIFAPRAAAERNAHALRPWVGGRSQSTPTRRS